MGVHTSGVVRCIDDVCVSEGGKVCVVSGGRLGVGRFRAEWLKAELSPVARPLLARL